MAGTVEKWLSEAVERQDVYYFSIYAGEELVGQIFLHDINEQAGEALVGYHLFEASRRGAGAGSAALALLQEFVIRSTGLLRLVIITASDNRASQRVAQKCGFRYVSAPREDSRGKVFRWDVWR